jgi:hypothetical protein
MPSPLSYLDFEIRKALKLETGKSELETGSPKLEIGDSLREI